MKPVDVFVCVCYPWSTVSVWYGQQTCFAAASGHVWTSLAVLKGPSVERTKLPTALHTRKEKGKGTREVASKTRGNRSLW
eukprot:g35904.t1